MSFNIKVTECIYLEEWFIRKKTMWALKTKLVTLFIILLPEFTVRQFLLIASLLWLENTCYFSAAIGLATYISVECSCQLYCLIVIKHWNTDWVFCNSCNYFWWSNQTESAIICNPAVAGLYQAGQIKWTKHLISGVWPNSDLYQHTNKLLIKMMILSNIIPHYTNIIA